MTATPQGQSRLDETTLVLRREFDASPPQCLPPG